MHREYCIYSYILIIIGLTLFISSVGIAQTTWNVPAGGDIQSAIDSASAGDTVQLEAGTYTGQVRIYKNNITLRGVGSTSVIQAEPSMVWSFTLTYTYKPVVGLDNVSGIVIEDLKIDGLGLGGTNNRFTGVGIWNSSATLRNLTITRMRDNPFGGVQHGYGVEARNNTGSSYSVTIQNCDINDFQKNGIEIRDSGYHATISGNTVTGHGPTNLNAQNGIVIVGIDATVQNNTLSGFHYTGGTWSSTTILYMSGASGTVTGNTLTSGIQSGIYGLDAGPMTITNNRVTITSLIAGVYYSGIAFGEYYSSGHFNAVISNNTLTGNGNSLALGMDLFTNAGTISVTGTGNSITNFGTGISIYEGSAGTISSLSINNSDIVGNTDFGASSNTSVAADLTNNWWGACDGPSGVGTGSGDAVTANILYSPWGCLSNPPTAVIDALPQAGLLPQLDVIFDGTGSYDRDGTISSWNWSLGNGSTANGPTVSGVYHNVGYYTVRLTVTDSSGQSGSTTTQVGLFDPANLEVVLSGSEEPVILRANGEGQVVLSFYIYDKSTGQPILLNFGPSIQTGYGTLSGSLSFNPSTGAYSQTLISGQYGGDTVSIVVDGKLIDSISVQYQWPLPPVGIMVEDILNRSLFKGQWYKKITWSHNPDQYYQIKTYRVYRSIDSINWVLAGEVSSDKTEFFDGSYTAKMSYIYRLTSIDTAGYESEKSGN
ncbi:MAG: right-handed parallel beta-helix repeat-containing protein [Acidobacteria bacterium]|nr:right-handed parallel beta-helix repeat-containing protein [Acidobacteriota bacterium]